MRALVLLLLSCVSLFAADTDDAIIPLKSGEVHFVAYTLSYLHDPGAIYFRDLVLTLRTGGAKYMSFGPITSTNFDLRDANGNSIEVHTRSLSRDMTGGPDGEAIVIHLTVYVSPAQDSPQPWTLRFRAGAEIFPTDSSQPWDLTITGINLQKRATFTIETLVETAVGGIIVGLLIRYVSWPKKIPPKIMLPYLPWFLGLIGLVGSIGYEAQRLGSLTNFCYPLDRFIQQHLDAIGGLSSLAALTGIIIGMIVLRRSGRSRLVTIGTIFSVLVLLWSIFGMSL